MARGGKRAQRAKRAAQRFSGSGGGSNGFAQSGGKQTSFYAKGGVWSKPSAGANGAGAGGSVRGRGKFANGTPYKVRQPGGDANLVRGAGGSVHSAPDLVAKGNGIPNPAKRVMKPGGAARQRGGSTQ